jgi:hypothetical protein
MEKEIIVKKIRESLEKETTIEPGPRCTREEIINDIIKGVQEIRDFRKCFYCSNDAIAICNSCSPTSSTGLTKPKPLCADCIANGRGINILHWLIPEDEAKKIQDALDSIDAIKKTRSAKK